MRKDLNKMSTQDSPRWVHPLFKPSKRQSLETGIFSGNKRFSPKYHKEIELQSNLRTGQNNYKGNFGKLIVPSTKNALRDHRFTFSIATVFIACVFSIFIFLVQAKFSSSPSIYAVDLAEFKFPDFNPIDKEKFLLKLSEEKRRHVQSQVQYVADLIDDHHLSHEEARKLAFLIVAESAQWGYDPLFVTAIIKSESTFKKHAVSPVGATGLMQIMPGTGRFISNLKNVVWQESMLRDPQYNIRLGLAYLKYLDDIFKGDKVKILVAYNWGPANVISALKNSRSFPISCVHYARSIIKNHGRWNTDYATRMVKVQNVYEVLS
jgi:hypothetical protein